jgi:uncharacterized protein (TIGR03435 family)
MLRRTAGCGLAILAYWFAAVARGADVPSFEVASIKPAEGPQMMGGGRMQMRVGRGGGPGTSDPSRITVNNQSLRDLIATAYDVKRYQVSGPDWLDSQRFDIVAKVPEGASKEQVPAMWQNLLKERFGLAVHHDTKEMAMYGLLVAKNGPKLKESEDQSDPPQTPPPDAGPPVPLGPPKMGKDGMLELPRNMLRPGALMMMMMPGRMRMAGTGVTIASLVENLVRMLDRPVVDQTGLTKRYDITLEFSPEGMGPMRGMPGPPPGMDKGLAGGGEMRPPESVESVPLPVALQAQLGLRLDSKKGPVDLVVIDHLEKTPTEN